MNMHLKILMLKKGITSKQLAKALGVHRNTISYKMSGKGSFTITELQIIRGAFFPEVSLDDLI